MAGRSFRKYFVHNVLQTGNLLQKALQIFVAEGLDYPAVVGVQDICLPLHGPDAGIGDDDVGAVAPVAAVGPEYQPPLVKLADHFGSLGYGHFQSLGQIPQVGLLR